MLSCREWLVPIRWLWSRGVRSAMIRYSSSRAILPRFGVRSPLPSASLSSMLDGSFLKIASYLEQVVALLPSRRGQSIWGIHISMGALSFFEDLRDERGSDRRRGFFFSVCWDCQQGKRRPERGGAAARRKLTDAPRVRFIAGQSAVIPGVCRCSKAPAGSGLSHRHLQNQHQPLSPHE